MELGIQVQILDKAVSVRINFFIYSGLFVLILVVNSQIKKSHLKMIPIKKTKLLVFYFILLHLEKA